MIQNLTFILRPIIFFVVTLLLYVLQRYCFVMVYPELFGYLSNGDLFSAVCHGVGMDATVAGYLTVLPLLFSIVFEWIACTPRSVRVYRGFCNIYSGMVSLVMSFIMVLDAALYPVWGFRLDANPIYYFISSPRVVLHGLSASQYLVGLALTLVIGIVFFMVYRVTWCRLSVRRPATNKARGWQTASLVVMGGLLFCVIRGGVTVSTMNLSRAYFSSDQRLNHIAINPAFSLISSLTHQNGVREKYKFFPNAQVPELMTYLGSVVEGDEGLWDGMDTIISHKRPDIYLIILESFSSHLFPSLGGEPIAMRLDSVAQDGLLFTEAYANAFRTDRALPAILNAFPGLPDEGVTKNVKNIERLPDLANYMKKNRGYAAEYYYGGDLNFTNMNALLVANGFDKIYGDKDFPINKRLGKWGAHDDALFDLVSKHLPSPKDGHLRRPTLRVIQTSSSHEPFEVPFKKLANPAANAFAFTDSVVGSFIKKLKASPNWEKSLVVLVADHYGAYPENLTDRKDRHHIPLIMTGGALIPRGRISTPVSQVVIAPTLLGLLGIKHDRFIFGRNVFDPREPVRLFFYSPEEAYLETKNGWAVINLATMKTEADPTQDQNFDKISPLNPRTQLRAWLQAMSQYYD